MDGAAWRPSAITPQLRRPRWPKCGSRGWRRRSFTAVFSDSGATLAILDDNLVLAGALIANAQDDPEAASAVAVPAANRTFIEQHQQRGLRSGLAGQFKQIGGRAAERSFSFRQR